jgi:hypothetical protein
MKIAHKLLLGATALTLVPLAITAGALWRGTTQIAAQTVDMQLQTQLTALRDQKAQEVQTEFDAKLAALQALASNRTTVEALKGFKPAFQRAAADLAKVHDATIQRDAMRSYVKDQFAPEFAKRNPMAAPSLEEIIEKRDDNAAALQHEYIVANTNILGEKDKLVSARHESVRVLRHLLD